MLTIPSATRARARRVVIGRVARTALEVAVFPGVAETVAREAGVVELVEMPPWW
jgi:hypothetical protein